MNPTPDEIISKLAGKIPVIESMKDVEEAVLGLLASQHSEMGAHERAALAAEVASFGPISVLMADQAAEDIMINALNPIFVFDSQQGMVKTGIRFKTYSELDAFIKRLLLFAGKSEMGRISDLCLPGGARANVVLSPLGPQITIRRFKQQPPSIIDLVEWGMMDYNVAAQLWLYAEGYGVKPANMLIAGAPSSGKTTLLNAMFSFFPTNQRIVVIEDTMELNTKTEENCSRLVSGEGVTMEDLVKNSLRMRPDRLILGEVRGSEAKDLMTAMNIGKICMGTIHANTPREAVMRLENEPMNVPSSMVPLIDVILTTGRFSQEGEHFRRITGISEIGGMEGNRVLIGDRFNFDYQTRALREISPSVTYRDRLALAAGIQPTEIIEEIKRREQVLRKLKGKGVTTIEQISLFCKKYNENPDEALEKLGL